MNQREIEDYYWENCTLKWARILNAFCWKLRQRYSLFVDEDIWSQRSAFFVSLDWQEVISKKQWSIIACCIPTNLPSCGVKQSFWFSKCSRKVCRCSFETTFLVTSNAPVVKANYQLCRLLIPLHVATLKKNVWGNMSACRMLRRWLRMGRIQK